MKTTSILESIRNKINKIEKNNSATTEGTNPTESHDDFEYIDDNSKNLVDSKHNSVMRVTDSSKNQEQNVKQATDEDFDFLSDGSEEGSEASKAAAVVASAPQTYIPPAAPVSNVTTSEVKPNDDLDLDNIDIDDIEEQATQVKNPANELDLDSINVDEIEENQNTASTPVNLESTASAPEEDSSDLRPNNELDLDNLDIEEEPSPPQPIQSANNELDLEEEKEPEIETQPEQNINNSINEQSAPIQNYQEPVKNIMSNPNNKIISEEVVRQTRDTVRDIINSVPKPQNHQVLSGSAPAFRSGETIEDMVSAILAPKLEQWIHENLPPMVEQIVKSEIKRLLPKDDN